MARTKGMLNLSGNLEVNAQAPLDARTIVPTEADLTVANNFPYPYVGLEVYVTGTGKKFRLINLDTTQSSSWHEVGEGGGGSGLPSGGTAGQYLVKQSATDGDADWQSLSAFTGATSQAAGAAGLVPAPAIGDEGKVLFGNGLWGALPSVDLSVLSNEAFQFSTDEKPIGMWTDRKIVYQKVFTNRTMPSANGLIANTVVADLEKAIKTTIIATGGNQIIINPSLGQNIIAYYKGTSGIWVDYTNNPSWVYGSTVEVIIQYTKTTDSPLSSDEKFAGVTSGGEVIYEREFSTTEITSGNYFTANLSYKDLLDVKGYADLYAGSELNGCLTFPQTILAGVYEGVYANVKSNMAKTAVVVYFKDGRTNPSTAYKLKNVHFTVRYTKSS